MIKYNKENTNMTPIYRANEMSATPFPKFSNEVRYKKIILTYADKS